MLVEDLNNHVFVKIQVVFCVIKCVSVRSCILAAFLFDKF